MTEHFCTHFDAHFVPAGLALYHSLEHHAGDFVLWVVCLDKACETQLTHLNLPHMRLIPLAQIETAALQQVKPGRTRAEYCWTLTPFIPQAVLDRCPDATRVTYLDADLFFFDSPQSLLAELDAAAREVLITEHAYDPRYDLTGTSGRFCVQFLTFCRTPAAQTVLTWWQDRCLEWCFDRMEDGKYGDQKYLDCWPERFADTVHVCQQQERTLAPWNVSQFARQGGGSVNPVFYHFQGLRIVSPHRVRLYSGYQISAAGLALYVQYLQALSREAARLVSQGIAVPLLPVPKPRFAWLRHLKWVCLTHTVRYASLDY